jgi:hypothetical protein
MFSFQLGWGEKLALVWCLGISLCLIGRMWLKDRDAHWSKKLCWSLVLCVPLVGWVFYGAFYRPLPEGDVPSSTENFWGS